MSWMKTLQLVNCGIFYLQVTVIQIMVGIVQQVQQLVKGLPVLYNMLLCSINISNVLVHNYGSTCCIVYCNVVCHVCVIWSVVYCTRFVWIASAYIMFWIGTNVYVHTVHVYSSRYCTRYEKTLVHCAVMEYSSAGLRLKSDSSRYSLDSWLDLDLRTEDLDQGTRAFMK